MTELSRPPERKANQNLSFSCFNYFFALFDQTSPKRKETKTWQLHVGNRHIFPRLYNGHLSKAAKATKARVSTAKPPHNSLWTLLLKFIQGQNSA